MSGKRRVVVQVVEVPMVGVQEGGIRFCLLCGHEFKAGDLWRKVARLGRGGYAFGACNGCWAERAQASKGGVARRGQPGEAADVPQSSDEGAEVLNL